VGVLFEGLGLGVWFGCVLVRSSCLLGRIRLMRLDRGLLLVL
jgi:hypothetical protein